LIVFDLNNDDVVDENWLGELVAAISSSPDVGIVCGKRFAYGKNRILDSAGGKINFFTGETPVIGQNRVDSEEYSFQRDVDYFGVILTTREVLKKVGLCDPDYYIYHEDADFCLRVKRAGYRVVYVPSAVFWHKGSSTVGKFSYLGYYYLNRTQIRFILKNFPLRYMFCALTYCLVVRTGIDLLLAISPIRKLAIRLFPRFSGYMKCKSNPKLIKAKKEAITWNIKNIKKTIQARSSPEV
jgi:GT2 family glycosyltransferase